MFGNLDFLEKACGSVFSCCYTISATKVLRYTSLLLIAKMVTLHNTMEESSSNKDCENVKVVVRVRPLNDKEMSADYR